MPTNWLFWVLFHVFVFAMLALDLGVFHRKARLVPFREALVWTSMWIALAAIFAALIYFFGHAMTGEWHRPTRVLSLEFVTGYVVEEALSVDNLFVFLLLFRYFGVPGEYQHKVLFWGILGALITRAVFILTGITLVNRFHWVIYLFGAFLVYAGAKLVVQKDNDQIDPASNPVARFFRGHVAMISGYGDGRFIVYREGKRYATLLALVVVVVETTDVVFATDSIPAILAISRDPFIVYTSNVFAILGLRSLFFALAGMMKMFHLLHYGLAVILIFIGAKMLASKWWEVPTGWALATVACVLVVSVTLSLAFPEKETNAG
ncbi:MAG: TerC/Alx family metal homeostasis membrane protein [Candidatus Korobacteraceae bacterium]|jgi:tellurite resistance protein TerC